jgi:hypothetical protein
MRTSIWRPRGMVAFAAALFLLAVGAVVAGVALLRSSPTASGASFEVGRWLLQLGTVLAGTGLITAVFRQVDASRARRESWTTMLQDLVVRQDAIEGAGMRVASNPDAETYADLAEQCRDLRALLRRIIALPEVHQGDGSLRQQIDRIRRYLKPLVEEHERNTLRLSRQESLDKKIFDARLQRLAKATGRLRPSTTGRVFQPTGVSKLLRDEKEFPALAALMRDLDHSESGFREQSEIDKAYEKVKSGLRRNAGARGPRRTS